MIETAETGPDPRIDPCPHMRNWVSSLADGTLRGIARWYTQFHSSHCPRCGKALEALRSLRDRLRKLAGFSFGTPESMPSARRDAVMAEMDKIDASG